MEEVHYLCLIMCLDYAHFSQFLIESICLSFQRRGRSVWTPQVVEDILQRVEDRPDIRTPEVSRAVNKTHSIVWLVLWGEGLHPYHVQKVQAFIRADYAPRVEFARWFLKQLEEQPDFSAHVLFPDESTFTPEGISNTHSLHVWASRNPHGTRPHEYQKCFSANAWAGIVGDHLIGPYILPFRLDSRTYLTFLRQSYFNLLQPTYKHVCGSSSSTAEHHPISAWMFGALWALNSQGDW
ncbi:hypothetical protein AVEN_32906-1 [Araneus ventricosus]|uniref:Uncharacterized protein n=1 Tax=Araneus ventricosus TaxID=182803 RepID=A0A4Y2RTB2_ARAVE|nr:hypothetical protein AVEN_32906-1 [Araneus ventricosus]